MDQKSAIDEFIDKLIEDKGFTDLLPDVKDQLKKDISMRLDDFIAARVIAALSDEDLATFEQMLKDGKSKEEIQQFTSSHVTDFTEFLTNVLLEFRGVYLGVIQPPIGGEANTPSDDVAPPPPPPPAPVAE